MLDKLAQEYSDQIDLIKVNADEEDNFDLLAQYDVKSIPTLVLLKGDAVVSTMVGAQSEAVLRSWVGEFCDTDQV